MLTHSTDLFSAGALIGALAVSARVVAGRSISIRTQTEGHSLSAIVLLESCS